VTSGPGSLDERAVTRALEAFVCSELVFDQSGVSPDADLFGTGLVDSVGLQRLVAHLEDTYGIRVADEDLVPENFGTLDALGRFVARRVAEGP
jgi:acyl carrier protein